MTSLIKHFRFLAKTPKATFRIIDGTFRTRILRQNRLRNGILALTLACNHKCKICSSNLLLKKTKKSLTLEEWYKVVEQLKKLGCVHFELTGGEPTLKGLEFLKKLISYINKNNDCIVNIATNGTLVNKTWFRELRKSGLNTIEFNIQSINPKIHDEIVGNKGNLKKILHLIPIAKKEGLNVCINTCLGSYNMKEIKELIKFGNKNNLLTLLNLSAPTGRLTGKEELRLTNFKEWYYNLLNKHSLVRSDTSYNFRGKNLCPGGIEKIYITAYGDVMQCTFCQISFGNVLKEPLKDIYKRFCNHPLIKKKDICKHTFNKEFREKWINPIINKKEVPVPLKEHPNYHLYK